MRNHCEASTVDELVSECAVKADPGELLDIHLKRPGSWDKPSPAYERIGAGVETGLRNVLEQFNIPVETEEVPGETPAGPSFVKPRSFPIEIVGKEFPNVTHLGLFGAGVTSIPGNRDANLKTSFPSLETLDLERNFIQKLNASFLPSGIVGLNASSNPITEIMNVKMLRNLWSLYLRGTGITSIDGLSGIEELPLLSRLDLRGTKAGNLSMPSRQNFHVAEDHGKNGVVILKSYLRRGNESRKSRSYPVAGSEDECDANYSAWKVYRSGMYLNDLGLDSIPKCLEYPKDRKIDIIDLSNNGMPTMGLSMTAGKERVKELYVAGNSLSTVDDISGFSELETLDASDNNIDAVPEGITSLHKLKRLNLSGNIIGTKTAGADVLETLAPIARMKKLEYLDLRRNSGLPPVICSTKHVFAWKSPVERKALDELKKGLEKNKCYVGR